jgi:hypothetical protein
MICAALVLRCEAYRVLGITIYCKTSAILPKLKSLPCTI